MFKSFTYLLCGFYQVLANFDKKQKLKNQKRIESSFVISVGNLTLGGTGKTPFIIYLAKILQTSFSKSVCVLSRGYKAKKSKEGIKVELDSNPKLCGDEPLLIKQNNPNLEVIIGKNRFKAYQEFSTQKNTFTLLDDGFQHYQIFRNLDIVLIDSQNPVGNGLTLPFGTLREPIESIQRANIVVFSKYHENIKHKIKPIKEKILKINPSLSFFYFSYKFKNLQNYKKEVLDIGFIKSKKVLLFSGIGNQSYFFSMVKSLKPKTLQTIFFPDHFDFMEKEVSKIQKTSQEYDLVVCTEKDFVKIKKPFSNLYFFSLKTQLNNEKDFIQILFSCCKSLK